MVDSSRYKEWYVSSKKSFRGAEILFASEDADVYEIIAFHCQQTVEKYLKGTILQHKTELINSHSLVYLYDRANESGQILRINRRDCAYLNQFYIETRYPADTPMQLREDEVTKCLDIARKVI